MRKRCEHCGKTFEARRKTAKYCSSSCRGKATHGRQAGRVAEVVPMAPPPGGKKRRTPAPPPPAAPAAPSEPVEVDPDALVAAVTKDLDAAKKLESYAGQQAVFLAHRLAQCMLENPSGVAALSKELDRMMTVLLKDLPEAPDALDDIQGVVLQLRTRRA